ncbi:hypothetical protein [Paracoccus aminovorans]|nr:hypothetical protein [Paracoccus aminovorans]
MTEEQAFDPAKKARRLHALIGQIERDYAALISAKNMKSLCDQLLSEFD